MTAWQALLGMDGELVTLNAELSRRIAAGEADLSTPGLAEHLWAVTLAKMAVDQPTYAAYRASLAGPRRRQRLEETHPRWTSRCRRSSSSISPSSTAS